MKIKNRRRAPALAAAAAVFCMMAQPLTPAFLPCITASAVEDIYDEELSAEELEALLEAFNSGEVQSKTYEDTIEYLAFPDHIAISGYRGSDAAVTIPETIDDLPVTEIYANAFKDNASLVSVTLPEGLVRIGDQAFCNCQNLTDVTVPASVTFIKAGAFCACRSLTSIGVAEGNAAFSSVDGVLYNAEGTALLCYPAGRTETEFAVPPAVELIVGYAFTGSSLVSVTMSDAVEKIQISAFANCASLQSVTLSAGLHAIGASCFAQCGALREITVPDSVSEIGNEAFRETGVEAVTLGAGLTHIGGKAFYRCRSLTAFTVSAQNPYYSAPDGILYGDAGETLIQFPIQWNGDAYAVPEGTKTVGNDAFYVQRTLKSIQLPESLTCIGDEAFAGSYFTEIKIPDCFAKQGTVGKWAFSDSVYMLLLPEEDGLIIASGGILLAAPYDQETIVVPDTVRLAAPILFQSDSGEYPAVKEIEFMGSVHICKDAFRLCKALDIVTVHGDLTAEDGALNTQSNRSVNKLNVSGTTTGEISETVKTDRVPLQYVYGEADAAEQYASVRSIRPKEVQITADTTGFHGHNHGFRQTDALQEIQAPDGSVYAVYAPREEITTETTYYDEALGEEVTETTISVGLAQTVYLIPEDPAQETVTIRQENFTFGSAAFDDNGDLYIFWGHDAHELDDENLLFVRYDRSGRVLGSRGFPLSFTGSGYPFLFGNAALGCKDGILVCFYDNQWGGNHLFAGHQGSEMLAVRTSDLECVGFSEAQGSHSFGVSMTETEYGFAGIQMEDGTRGIHLNTFHIHNGEVTPTMCGRFFHASGQYGTNEHQLDGNATYMGMDGVARSRSTYAIAGKGQRLQTDEIFKESSHQDDPYDLFVRMVDLSGNVGDLAGEDRYNAETGAVVDQNIIWLTASKDYNEAGSAKIVTLRDGSYCVLWQQYSEEAYEGVRYVILDECGNVLRPETAVPNAVLSSTSSQPIVRGDTLTWAVADRNEETIVWYTLDLNDFTPKREIYADAEALAQAHGLDFTLEDGCFGQCGDAVYWVYLRDSQTLLIAGEGEMNSSSPDWSDIRDKVTNVYMSDGITTLSMYAFTNMKALTHAQLSDDLTQISMNAFANCTELTGLEFPAALQSIERYAFESCTGLTELTFRRGLTSIGERAFYGCTGLTEITFPEGLTSIGDYAFSGCSALTKLVLPEGLTELGDRTFYDCAALQELTLPSSLTVLPEAAIVQCPSLQCVLLPGTVEKVEFYGLPFDSLQQLIVLGKQTEINPEGYFFPEMTVYGYAGSKAETFAAEHSLRFVEIDGSCGNSLAWSVSDGALAVVGSGQMDSYAPGEQPWAAQKDSIGTVTVGEEVTAIGENAFAGITASVFVPENVQTIGENAIGKDCVIYGMEGSTAQTYAKENGFTFTSIDSAAPVQDGALALGDVTGDGSINAVDASEILIAAARLGAGEDSGLTPEQETAADINGDGMINATDAASVLLYAAVVGAGEPDAKIEDFA